MNWWRSPRWSKILSLGLDKSLYSPIPSHRIELCCIHGQMVTYCMILEWPCAVWMVNVVLWRSHHICFFGPVCSVKILADNFDWLFHDYGKCVRKGMCIVQWPEKNVWHGFQSSCFYINWWKLALLGMGNYCVCML